MQHTPTPFEALLENLFGGKPGNRPKPTKPVADHALAKAAEADLAAQWAKLMPAPDRMQAWPGITMLDDDDPKVLLVRLPERDGHRVELEIERNTESGRLDASVQEFEGDLVSGQFGPLRRLARTLCDNYGLTIEHLWREVRSDVDCITFDEILSDLLCGDEL